jgi:hypothetical protein
MGLMAMVFYLGKNYQSYQLEHLMLERETLVSRIEELETRNHNLVQKNAHLEGGSKIERDAYELANQELVRLQQERAGESGAGQIAAGVAGAKGRTGILPGYRIAQGCRPGREPAVVRSA